MGSYVKEVKATDVEVSELPVATYDDVQDYINFFGDRTLLSGGGITDNGDGTATVAAGTAWSKATDSDLAVGKFFDFSADASVSLTDQITNFVYLDYNGGVPQIVVTTTSIITHGFKQDHIHIATIFRDGTTLQFHEESTIGIGRVNRVDMRLLEMHDADRVSGLITSDAGSLALSITPGVIYEGLSRHTTIVDGSVWATWHTTDSGSTWVEVTGQSTINNTQYNDVTAGLANLTANRYAVHWVYCDIDGGHLFIVYGQGNYTINQAEEVGVPASLPDIALHYGVLIAKIVVQEGQTSLEILYPWTTTFHSSLATDHGSLAGLTDDDHAQYVLADGTRALSGAWDMGNQLITNLKLGGTLDANSQALINVLDLDLGTESLPGTFSATLTAANAGTAWLIMSKDTSDILRPRLALSGGVDTAVWSLVNSTITGIVLSGALNANGNAITSHPQAITDNALVTVDGPAAGAPASGEYGRWTAAGLEGRSISETLADISPLTTRGDIMFRNATVSTRLAKGSDNTILAMGADNPEWKTPATILADLSGQAAAPFAWNGHNVTGIADLTLVGLFGNITTSIGIRAKRQNNNIAFTLYTPGVTPSFTDTLRLILTGRLATAEWQFQNSTVTGLLLSGALDVSGQYLTFLERVAPGAGAANEARMYAIVDGGTLTDMAVVFQDGTVDIFAQETTPLDAPIFTKPSGTIAKLVLKKDHPGSVKMVAVFPEGKEFVLKELEYHHPDKIAANVGSEGPLPGDWLVEDDEQIKARLKAEEAESQARS